jgi:glycosyltransferase involved in cell wall biosynthesis
MRITVILCTYNRCQSLARALESAAALELPPQAEWEVLVVDNNSKDETRSLIQGFCERYPGKFRYLSEPQPGKSHALNAGIRAARGDVLAFMDDDVKVDPEWLRNLTATLEDGRFAGSGGRILPEWTCPPPPWLPVQERYGLAPLAMFDLGPEAADLEEPPFGTNMAFRRDVFEKYGGFRTDLGPRPGSEIRNEDTEFGRRLLAAGERLRYEPSAVVHHSVPDNRLRQQYFLKWWADKARADIREHGTSGAKWFAAGVPLVFFRRLVVWSVRWAVATNPARRFASKLKVWATVGAIKECYSRPGDAIP